MEATGDRGPPHVTAGQGVPGGHEAHADLEAHVGRVRGDREARAGQEVHEDPGAPAEVGALEAEV